MWPVRSTLSCTSLLRKDGMNVNEVISYGNRFQFSTTLHLLSIVPPCWSNQREDLLSQVSCRGCSTISIFSSYVIAIRPFTNVANISMGSCVLPTILSQSSIHLLRVYMFNLNLTLMCMLPSYATYTKQCKLQESCFDL